MASSMVLESRGEVDVRINAVTLFFAMVGMTMMIMLPVIWWAYQENNGPGDARPPIHPYDSPRLVSLTRIYNERFPSAPSSPILVQHVENDFGPPPVVTSPAPVHTQYQLPARLTVPLPYVPYHRQSWAVAPPSKLSIAKSKIRFTVINVHRAVVDKFYLVWNKIKGRSAERRRRSDTGRSMELPIMHRPAWRHLASGDVTGTFTPSPTAANVTANKPPSYDGDAVDHGQSHGADGGGDTVDDIGLQRPVPVRVVGLAVD